MRKGVGNRETEVVARLGGKAYIFSLGVTLQVWLDRLILLVKLGQIWNEIFDDVGVG